jgi:hypothetical protein
MWRSVAIGVVLAGLLAGCSLGGEGGGAGSDAGLPSKTAVSGVVHRMVKALAPTDKVQAKCTVIDLRARCNIAVMDTEAPPGGVPIETVWFRLRQENSGWSVHPDCTSDSKDVLCRDLSNGGH